MTDLRCKKRIVEWIMANPGYVYSLFTFLPEHENEILPTAEEFEALTYNLNDWIKVEEDILDEIEIEMYPGAFRRYKYEFSPLNGSLKAQLFGDTENILYVVIMA